MRQISGLAVIGQSDVNSGAVKRTPNIQRQLCWVDTFSSIAFFRVKRGSSGLSAKLLQIADKSFSHKFSDARQTRVCAPKANTCSCGRRRGVNQAVGHGFINQPKQLSANDLRSTATLGFNPSFARLQVEQVTGIACGGVAGPVIVGGHRDHDLHHPTWPAVSPATTATIERGPVQPFHARRWFRAQHEGQSRLAEPRFRKLNPGSRRAKRLALSHGQGGHPAGAKVLNCGIAADSDTDVRRVSRTRRLNFLPDRPFQRTSRPNRGETRVDRICIPIAPQASDNHIRPCARAVGAHQSARLALNGGAEFEAMRRLAHAGYSAHVLGVLADLDGCGFRPTAAHHSYRCRAMFSPVEAKIEHVR